MKSILVIETPNNCSECPCCNERVCGNEYKGYVDGHLEWNSGRPSWCPLKDLPQKKDIDKTLEFGGYENIIQESLAIGYNACLEEITK